MTTKRPFIVVDDASELHISNGNNNSEVLLGSNSSILISKAYGPACFSNLRITPVVDEGWYWKIEMMNNATCEYEEMIKLRHEICYQPDSDNS